MQAKMPIGAVVFAMHLLHLTQVARVDVSWNDGDDRQQTSFYHLEMGKKRIKYDQEKSVHDETTDNHP
jgi:hypothetical protein